MVLLFTSRKQLNIKVITGINNPSDCFLSAVILFLLTQTIQMS